MCDGRQHPWAPPAETEKPGLSRTRATKEVVAVQDANLPAENQAAEVPPASPHRPLITASAVQHVLHRDYETRSTLDLQKVGPWKRIIRDRMGHER